MPIKRKIKIPAKETDPLPIPESTNSIREMFIFLDKRIDHVAKLTQVSYKYRKYWADWNFIQKLDALRFERQRVDEKAKGLATEGVKWLEELDRAVMRGIVLFDELVREEKADDWVPFSDALEGLDNGFICGVCGCDVEAGRHYLIKSDGLDVAACGLCYALEETTRDDAPLAG